MQIETIRHSLSHVLAQAIKESYPNAKFGIGPAIENGFYYDFDLQKNISPEVLPRIEKRMREMIKQNAKFENKSISKKEAEVLFKDQPFKLELINELPGESVLTYQNGNFIDLCAGPHVSSAKEIPIDAFKLTKTAGAYWKGSEKNKMLTRIYGIAFQNKKELDDYLNMQAEAEKRDHRVLGQKLELFMFDEEVGAGLPLWMPKGTILRKAIENYLYKELNEVGYDWLTTPHIGNINLWKTSGHWELYRENIYSPIKIDEEEYLLKPMNCPFHVKIYSSKTRSYRDLPIKYAELGTVYRYERSGTLHGLTRVRGFTQDDAHIFCTPEQLSAELTKLLKHGLKILKVFGFKNFTIYISTRPDKYAGTEEDWKKATDILKSVLEKLKLKYQIDPGGGVFYGPKIDIKIKDSINRDWQCTTIQVDFNLPNRFNLSYIDKEGTKQKPIMIHRALLGSMERFIGVLLEHHAGALPFWLSPVQIVVLPIGEKNISYARTVRDQFRENDIRAQMWKDDSLGKRIREAEMQKTPYIIVVGDKEMKQKSINVRERGKKDQKMMKLKAFLGKIK